MFRIPVFPRFAVVVGLSVVACGLVAGCGSGDRGTGSGPITTGRDDRPALSTDAKQPGEIIVEGEGGAPETKGPFAFDGRYRVRFVQFAPEDPSLDYTAQTPFVVDLQRRQGIASAHLFNAAAESGERIVALKGRLYVDVSFGDFPWVVRFTPIEG